MKATLESTSRIVELVLEHTSVVPARIWEGTTASGVKFHAFITRVAVAKTEDSSQFDKELKEMRVPSVEAQAFPERMIL